MLGAANTENSKPWKVCSSKLYSNLISHVIWNFYSSFFADPSITYMQVLIMDKVTVKVMSHSCKMADITDQGVSRTLNYIYLFLFIVSFIMWNIVSHFLVCGMCHSKFCSNIFHYFVIIVLSASSIPSLLSFPIFSIIRCLCLWWLVVNSSFTAVVEDLFRRRQPLPSMDAIYFIQPSKEK